MVPIFFHHLVDMLNRIRARSNSSAGSDLHHNDQRLGRILLRCQEPHLLSALIPPDNQDSPNQKLFISFLEASIVWSSSIELSILKNSGSLSLADIDQCREQILNILTTCGVHGAISSILELVRAIFFSIFAFLTLLFSCLDKFILS
jgi:hypothetical protein